MTTIVANEKRSPGTDGVFGFGTPRFFLNRSVRNVFCLQKKAREPVVGAVGCGWCVCVCVGGGGGAGANLFGFWKIIMCKLWAK